MAKGVIWLDTAKQGYRATIHYVKATWGEKSAEKLIDSVEEKVKLLTQFPHLGKVSKGHKLNVRKIVIKPHNILLYKLYGEVIVIVDFYNDRQDKPG